jgi:hypothetical protein
MRDAELGLKSGPAARHTERCPRRASDVRGARRERISGFTAFSLFFPSFWWMTEQIKYD